MHSVLSREGFLGILVLFCIGGCSADIDDEGVGGSGNISGIDSGEEMNSLQAAAVNGWYVGPFKVIGPTTEAVVHSNEYICVLTGFSGPLDTEDVAAHWVGAQLSVSGNGWTLRVGYGNTAEATCFRRAAFVGKGDYVNWMSGDMDLECNNQADVSTDLWWGDAASILNGVWGQVAGVPVRGQNSEVRVSQSGDGFTPSKLTTRCDKPGRYQGGRAHSFFVGEPSTGWVAKYNRISNINTSKFTDRSVSAPEASTMCHLTGVRASGTGNRIWDATSSFRIYAKAGTWHLTKSGPGTVEIRCLLRTQY